MNETQEELAELASDILEEGIEVSLKDGDLRNVFGAVVLANVVCYVILKEVQFLWKRYAKKHTANKSVETQNTPK